MLDALFSGSEEDQRAGLQVFDRLGHQRGNPADVIPSDVLIAWCEIDPGVRYPLSAAIVTFDSHVEGSVPRAWSEQAAALLVRSPEPERVLATFIERLRPMSWSGSRAAIMEANARLLDGVEALVPALNPSAMTAKSRLIQDAAQERQREVDRDRRDNERFEW